MEQEMNERIQQLWWQAGGHLSQGNQHGWPHYIIDDPEKFAELIVKECIDVVGKATASPNGYQALMKHFGVEE
jgi:hypothetical protein